MTAMNQRNLLPRIRAASSNLKMAIASAMQTAPIVG